MKIVFLLHFAVLMENVVAFTSSTTTKSSVSTNPPVSQKISDTAGVYGDPAYTSSCLSAVHYVAYSAAGLYSDVLDRYPLRTTAITGSFFSGVADLLAQVKNKEVKKVDFVRLFRFSLMGSLCTLLWKIWYDLSDAFIAEEAVLGVLLRFGLVDHSMAIDNSLIKMIRILALIVSEQIIATPLIFCIWDIPVMTILNGAPISRVPHEVRGKLYDLFIDNAKYWTWANVLIYSIPVRFRTVFSSLFDIVWSSIVSDHVVDCGKDE